MAPADSKDPVQKYLEWDARQRTRTRPTLTVLEALLEVEDRFLSRWQENRLPNRLESWLSAVFRLNLHRGRNASREIMTLNQRQ